jgi:hypothetical protein
VKYTLDMTAPLRRQMEQLQRMPAVIGSLWKRKRMAPQ